MAGHPSSNDWWFSQWKEERMVRNDVALVDPLNVGLPTDSELEASGYEMITKGDDDKKMDVDSNENGTVGESGAPGLPQSTNGQEVGANSSSAQGSNIDGPQGYIGSPTASTSNHGAPGTPSEQYFL